MAEFIASSHCSRRLQFTIRSISVGVDLGQVKDSLTLLSLAYGPLVCSLQPGVCSCHPPPISGWSVYLFNQKGWGSQRVSCLAINQIFLYKCGRWECERAGTKARCCGSVMASCHQVNCSGREDADTVADGCRKLAATVGGLKQSLFQKYYGEEQQMNLFLGGATMELLF